MDKTNFNALNFCCVNSTTEAFKTFYLSWFYVSAMMFSFVIKAAFEDWTHFPWIRNPPLFPLYSKKAIGLIVTSQVPDAHNRIIRSKARDGKPTWMIRPLISGLKTAEMQVLSFESFLRRLDPLPGCTSPFESESCMKVNCNGLSVGRLRSNLEKGCSMNVPTKIQKF
jgi:hypothetical protein